MSDHDTTVSVRCAILTCSQVLHVERRHATNLHGSWKCAAHRQEVAA